MEWLKYIAPYIPVEPVQFVYGGIAFCGGIARYLNGVANDGKRFNIGIFFASAFVSGFSGYMFALLGITLHLPQPMVFMMAGTGGFFGEQTMKLILEYVSKKVK